MPNKLVFLCTLLVGAGLVGWLTNDGRAAAPGEQRLMAETTYEALSFDALAQGAGGIVVGEVVAVSPTLWNQDDGSFWEDVTVDARGRESSETALPYYEITIAPRRTLVDTVGLSAPNAPVVATVIGMSPAGSPAVMTSDGEAVVDGGDAQGPEAGQTMVAFLRRTDMAWRGGTRPILQLMGDPGHQILQGSSPDAFGVAETGETLDLAALEARIAAARGSATE